MTLLPARAMQDYNSLNDMRQFFTWLTGRPKETTAGDRAKVRNRRPWGI